MIPVLGMESKFPVSEVADRLWVGLAHYDREDNAKSLSSLNTLDTDSIPSQLCCQHLLANWYKESVIL